MTLNVPNPGFKVTVLCKGDYFKRYIYPTADNSFIPSEIDRLLSFHTIAILNTA